MKKVLTLFLVMFLMATSICFAGFSSYTRLTSFKAPNYKNRVINKLLVWVETTDLNVATKPALSWVESTDSNVSTKTAEEAFTTYF